MAYTPENNPYIPGDPYSYDLKWMVEEIKKQREPEEEAAAAKASAEAAAVSAAEAKQIAENLSGSVEADALRAEQAAGRAETSAISAKYFLDTLGEEVAPAVSDWLDENITQPTTPVIDASLSVSGAAADAKAVGDKFSDFARIKTEPTYTWEAKTISTSGTLSNNNYQVVSDIIPCHPGDLFVNNTPATDINGVYFTMSICIYSGTTFQQKIGILTNRRYIIPEGSDGFRINFGRLTSSGVQFSASDYNYIDIDYYIQAAGYQKQVELEKRVDLLNSYIDISHGSMFAYTDFDESAHYWKADGTLDTSSLTHTQQLRIIQGKEFYCGTIANQEIVGAYFDIEGNWIAPMRASEAETISWAPSKGDGLFTFADIYKFTPPANACFISLNLRTENHNIRQSVSSRPVMLMRGSGNIFTDQNEIIAKYADRKLCVIGASTAMIDRMYASALNQYLSGWEEYLMLYYGETEIFGYSGGSMGSGYDEYMSVYNGIVGQAVDLSRFDDFIILNTKNGLTITGVGSWGNVDEGPGEHDTYMGGLRAIVDYIYTQNPKANIYLTTLQRDSRYFNANNVRRDIYNRASQETREMGAQLGLPVIDLEAASGFNKNTYYDNSDPAALFTYDGTHFNQEGGRQIGYVIRKAVIGI